MSKRKESLKDSIKWVLNPFRKDVSHKEFTLKSLHPKNLALGLDHDPYNIDPFPELTKELDRGGWPAGIKHIKRKIKKRKSK